MTKEPISKEDRAERQNAKLEKKAHEKAFIEYERRHLRCNRATIIKSQRLRHRRLKMRGSYTNMSFVRAWGKGK
jgi:hypothetical protein